MTHRGSLRDIEVCLGAVSEKRYHSGLRSGPVPRSTLADANEKRDWRIFAEFGQTLIGDARRRYAGEPWAVELDQAVYALDELLLEPGSIYVMDRGYVDFERLHRFHQARAVFITRAKKKEWAEGREKTFE